MNPYNSSRYIHTIWSLQPGKKAVASENTWFIYNKSTLVSTTTTSGCTDQISQMILQETHPRNLDPENIVNDNFNYEISGCSA